jgi:hypothetical protein
MAIPAYFMSKSVEEKVDKLEDRVNNLEIQYKDRIKILELEINKLYKILEKNGLR